VKSFPKGKIHYINRGLSEIGLKNYKAALSDAKVALKLDPDLPNVYMLIGMAKVSLKKYKEAISNFNKGIELANAEDLKSKIYQLRGSCKFEMKDFKGAEEDFTTALNIDSTNTFFMENRAISRFYSHNYSGSIEDFNDIKILSKKDSFLYARRADLIVDYYSFKTLKDYYKALDIDFTDGDLYIIKGIAEYIYDYDLEAIKDFNKAIELKPDNGIAYYYRALAKLESQKDYIGCCADSIEAFKLGIVEAKKIQNQFCR
ncbi:MAG TPA: hypothetical protein VNW06_06780, partial [Cytophagaceae bacterium]|nr:hypothetical protein [Cytophagaceae bacterium]